MADPARAPTATLRRPDPTAPPLPTTVTAARTGGPPPDDTPGRGGAPVATDAPVATVATVALAVLTAAAAAGFARVFAGPAWVWPVLLTSLGTHLACWVGRRTRLHPAAAAVVGMAAVVVLTVWTVIPGSTTYGLPLLHTWQVASAALTQVRRDFTATVAPVPTARGWVLLAVAGAGLVAVLADGLALRGRSALRGALPAVALFVVCSVVGTARGRTWATALLVAAVVFHLLVHRVTCGRAESVWFANRSAGMATSTLAVGAGAGLLAVLAALVITPVLPHSDGHGLLGWKGEGPGSGSSNREVPSPIVELPTRLLQESATKVFTVASPVPSYWRLTSLDDFNGIQWQSTDSYVGVSRQLPGQQPPVPGTRVVQESFHIQDLASIWMPTAFTPQAIRGGGQVSWDPVSDSLLASKATSNDLAYRLTSLQYLSTVDAARLSRSPDPAIDASTQRYVALPSTVPPSVRALARRITAGATNEYQRALALQDYFIDDPSYSYSLQPPGDGSSISALTTFLFVTKEGYCQQFAGAYAVLARAIGLPTRLAVGFTTGDPIRPGTYQVRNADYHTWPEVWFGRSIGWLPFEPTKGGGFTIPGASGYTGDTARVVAAPVTAPAQPTTTTVGGAPRASVAHPLPRGQAAPAATGRGVQHASAAPVLVALGGALAAGLLWVGANVAGRRSRWRRRRRRATGTDRVLVAWAEVTELLAWWGCRRRADETPREFAARVTAELRSVLGPVAVAHLGALAERAAAATYGDAATPDAEVAAAVADADATRRLIEFATPTSRVVARLIDPRLAWRPAPVDPAPSFGTPSRLGLGGV